MIEYIKTDIKTGIVGQTVRVADLGRYDTNLRGYKIDAAGKVWSNKRSADGVYSTIGSETKYGFAISVNGTRYRTEDLLRAAHIDLVVSDAMHIKERVDYTPIVGDWFVAVMVDGIPKFSSTPKSHVTEAIARAEAVRLARENDASFGVFKRTATVSIGKEVWK